MKKLLSLPLMAAAFVIDVSDCAFGGRPLNIDDAGPVGTRKFQVSNRRPGPRAGERQNGL